MLGQQTLRLIHWASARLHELQVSGIDGHCLVRGVLAEVHVWVQQLHALQIRCADGGPAGRACASQYLVQQQAADLRRVNMRAGPAELIAPMSYRAYVSG